jgi:hypothetical protein
LVFHSLLFFTRRGQLCPPFLSFHCHHRTLLQPSSRLRNRHCCNWRGVRRHLLSPHHSKSHPHYWLPMVHETNSLDLSHSLRFRQRVYATTSGTRPNRKRLAKPRHSSSSSIFIDCTRSVLARVRAICVVDVYLLLPQFERILNGLFLCCTSSL